jgi:hypothetical protein
MPVETQWYVEKRIIYQRLYGKVTLEDFIQSRDEMLEKLSQGEAPVHCIVSLLNTENFPSLIDMQKAAVRQKHPSMGWTILLINNTVLRFVASLLVQLATTQFRTAATLDEGLTFLQTHDDTIVKQ